MLLLTELFITIIIWRHTGSLLSLVWLGHWSTSDCSSLLTLIMLFITLIISLHYWVTSQNGSNATVQLITFHIVTIAKPLLLLSFHTVLGYWSIIMWLGHWSTASLSNCYFNRVIWSPGLKSPYAFLKAFPGIKNSVLGLQSYTKVKDTLSFHINAKILSWPSSGLFVNSIAISNKSTVFYFACSISWTRLTSLRGSIHSA